MVLAMSRPYNHPKTGVYWIRKRVPTDIAALTGRVLITRTLGTKDPEQAKRKHTEVLAQLEAEWEQVRLGSLTVESAESSETHPARGRGAVLRSITNHEAHQFAKAVHDEWLSAFRENPSEQLFWHPNLYDRMWTDYPLPETKSLPGVEGIADAVPGQAPIENFQWRSMRTRSISDAKRILGEDGFEDDPWSVQKTARAVAAAIQRASVTLARIEAGEEAIPATEAASSHKTTKAPLAKASTGASSPVTAGSLALTQLVELWWKEAKAVERKVSTYESYRNTIGHLVAFLEHDRAHSVTRQNIIAFRTIGSPTLHQRPEKWFRQRP
jgi:hypothetical protein